MITETINNSSLGISNGTIQYPNAYCFTFNPNYIFLELGTDISSVIVIVTDGDSTYSVTCSLFNGSGRCYVSRLMEMLFDKSYLSRRSTEVTFKVCANNSDQEVISVSSSIAIWGSMKVGDTFGGGYMLNKLYDESYHAKFMREVVWFKAFPFKVSMFSPSSSKSLTLKEDGGSEMTVQSYTKAGIFDVTLTDTATSKKELLYKIELEADTIRSTFTNVFDKTFTGSQYRYLDELIKVTVSDDQEGYYIRWIDQFGFLEYWLFRKSTLTNKNTLDSTSIETDTPVDGVYYSNHERVIHVDNSATVKCGAINLTMGQYKTVSTILASPHIDMFMGYSLDRNEVWLPINIVAGSYKQDETKELQDFELQITLPDTAAQTL